MNMLVASRENAVPFAVVDVNGEVPDGREAALSEERPVHI